MAETYNRHHLLFTRHKWAEGNAKRLRESLVFKIPVSKHEELHRAIAEVPLPPSREINRLWAQRRLLPVDMSMKTAFRWLLSEAEDKEFLMALSKQYVFFAKNGLL